MQSVLLTQNGNTVLISISTAFCWGRVGKGREKKERVVKQGIALLINNYKLLEKLNAVLNGPLNF